MIIWGYRTRNNVMGQLPYVCRQCGRNGYHAVVRTSRYFTLFFIPIFPIGKSTTARCNLCGFQEKVDNARADALLAQPASQQQMPAATPPQTQAPAYPSTPAQMQPNQPYPYYPPQQDPVQGQQGWR